MKEKIEYIKTFIGKNGNISIYINQLSINDYSELSKHFNILKEPFGYFKFTNK